MNMVSSRRASRVCSTSTRLTSPTTQHTTGHQNVLSCANLQMLLGNMGVPGGGVNPLRGQNNVQGACDMGALVPKMRQHRGRPWEFTKVATTCPYCGVGCQFYLNVKDGRIVDVTSKWNAPANHGWTCVKGRFGWDFVHHPDRLTRPMIRREKGGELEEVTWDEALDFVASRFGEIKEQHGPGALGVLSSAKCTNEENFVMQKFARAVIGTNNVDHCARL